MKRQSLWKISVTTTPEAQDAVAELLGAIFKLPPSVYTASDSGVSTVTIYLRQKPQLSREGREVISTGLKRIRRCGLSIGAGKVLITKIRHEDWAESWKRYFKPIEVGGALLIRPSWSKRKRKKGQVLVILDPGLSFGTGQHPTTAFCLRQTVGMACGRRIRCSQSPATGTSFLDLGTGSGILAIAAAKLGYSPVHALDFDPEAVRIARANARANHALQSVKIRRGDVSKLPIRPGRPGHRYHLVCANLTADLLMAQRRRIAAQLQPGGTLILAGILRSEFNQVQKTYKILGLRLISRRNDKEWSSGSFRSGA